MTQFRQVVVLIGYVHNVSPQKASSFNVRFQTDSKSCKKICFDKEKHKILMSKKIGGDPIKLKKIQENANSNSNFASYVISKRSLITDVDQIQVKFEKSNPGVKFLPLSTEFEVNQLVSVEASLDLKYANERSVVVGTKATKILKQVYLVDNTGSMKLTMWEEWITFMRNALEFNQVLKLKNLLVKEFRGNITLTTCSDTQITASENNDISLSKNDKLSRSKNLIL